MERNYIESLLYVQLFENYALERSTASYNQTNANLNVNENERTSENESREPARNAPCVGALTGFVFAFACKCLCNMFHSLTSFCFKKVLQASQPTEFFGNDFTQMGQLISILKELDLVKGDSKLNKKMKQ